MTEQPRNLEKILAQVRTLLAIADGHAEGNEGERATARERAERLMLRFSVDMAQVEQTSESKRAPVSLDHELAGAYRRDRQDLYATVYRAFGCQTVREQQVEWDRRTGRRRVTREVLKAYGFTADVQMARTLAEHVEPQMLSQMAAHGGTAADRRMFAHGFILRIGERLQELYGAALQEAAQDGTSSAVVVARRGAEVAAAVAAAHPNLQPGSRRRLSGRGWTAGAAAAEDADIMLAGRKLPEARGELSA
jgi:hypothetical protein